MEKIGGAAET